MYKSSCLIRENQLNLPYPTTNNQKVEKLAMAVPNDGAHHSALLGKGPAVSSGFFNPHPSTSI